MLLGIAVAAGAAWFLGVDPNQLLASLTGVSPWAVAGCLASSFVVASLQALRWCTVMRPLLRVDYASAWRAHLMALSFNAVLPARGGDLLRVQYFGKKTGISRATILGTELVDRWLDFSGWIPTFVVLVLVSSPPAWLVRALGIFASVLVVWACAMAIIAFKGWKPKGTSKFALTIAALLEGFKAFRSKRVLLTALFIAPLPWLWESIVLTLVGQAFGLELTVGMAFSVLMGFNLAMAVPTPGGVGTVEAGGTAALAFFGFDQSKALAFMIVYHFSQLLPVVIAGIAVLVSERGAFLRAAKPFRRAEAVPPA